MTKRRSLALLLQLLPTLLSGSCTALVTIQKLSSTASSSLCFMQLELTHRQPQRRRLYPRCSSFHSSGSRTIEQHHHLASRCIFVVAPPHNTFVTRLWSHIKHNDESSSYLINGAIIDHRKPRKDRNDHDAIIGTDHNNEDQVLLQSHDPIWKMLWKSSCQMAVVTAMIGAVLSFGMVAKADQTADSQALLSSSPITTTTTTQTVTAPVVSKMQSTTTHSVGQQYWSIMKSGTPQERTSANEALLDYAVGTTNTMLYDNSGGAYFQPHDFYERWRHLKEVTRSRASINSHTNHLHTMHQLHHQSSTYDTSANIPSDITMETREGAVKGLKWLVSTLDDPFSKYLTREELLDELNVQNDGFLGLGALVEPPQDVITRFSFRTNTAGTVLPILLDSNSNNYHQSSSSSSSAGNPSLLSGIRVANLPIVTAVIPDSPAERCGIVVGDRIVAVGQDSFLGRTAADLAKTLQTRYAAENYLGVADLTIAKPVVVQIVSSSNNDDSHARYNDDHFTHNREVVIGYRPTRVRVPTRSVYPYVPYSDQGLVAGGDDIVHYELLTPSDSILLDQDSNKVGYIRLTRFSRAATAGYVHAITELEAAGAKSFIIDVRNNYGGVIQEAMLTASTLLRDPHAVLCYTMNSRGGFTPHEVEEYVADSRYPGYLLSAEPQLVTLQQVKREHPDVLIGEGKEWSTPTFSRNDLNRIFRKTDGVSRQSKLRNTFSSNSFNSDLSNRLSLLAQKKVVILINEGTASSAEVFASALHDNGRLVALVGTSTYGKGLIQHTFRLPDGGGLRLTVAEYLTPTLHHVTNVGSARFDPATGEWIGGGIRPDISCESYQGIPGNVGADICVGMAFDALQDAESQEAVSVINNYYPSPSSLLLRRVGGSQDGSGTRRPIVAGVVRDDF